MLLKVLMKGKNITNVVLSSQNNALLLEESTQGLSGLPIPIFFCNKGELVCVRAGVGTKELLRGRDTM